MDNNNATAARTRAPVRVAVFVCIVALAAAAGVSGARLVPHEWRASLRSASLQSPAALFGRSGSGPASFADIVDAVKPAVIGVQTKRAENSDERSGSDAPADRFFRQFGAPPLVPETPGGRQPARVVTTKP